MGVGLDGAKDVLGMWIQQTEGAKFWMGILTELRNRGVQDVLVLCADGLVGLPDAVPSRPSFPRRFSRPASCTWSDPARGT